jgi:molecular chaperone DnaK (HSP70)
MEWKTFFPHLSLDKPFRVTRIDLGTTKSIVTEIVFDVDKDYSPQIRCVPISQSTDSSAGQSIIVPSCIALHNEKTLIGKEAKELWKNSEANGLMQLKNVFMECKNDMGLKKTYSGAPQGFRTASEIAGHLLKFLTAKIDNQSEAPASGHTVVTVPASFGIAQRIDTIKAMSSSGICPEKADLLEEPMAAFLDYLISYAEPDALFCLEPKNLLVLDFGGGTCDVSIFRIIRGDNKQPLTVSPLSIARYHRLGGGDIDAAIMHEALLPQLCTQNNLSPQALEFVDKKFRMEPVLKPVAEQLKILLCNNYKKILRDGTKREVMVPGTFPCMINGQEYTLTDPVLSLDQFESILEPFLDLDLLYARDTEYRLTASIFSPIANALDTGDLKSNDNGHLIIFPAYRFIK